METRWRRTLPPPARSRSCSTAPGRGATPRPARTGTWATSPLRAPTSIRPRSSTRWRPPWAATPSTSSTSPGRARCCASVRLGLGSPPTYGGAFRPLADAKVVDGGLAERLARAAAFRNLVVHAYGRLDLARVHVIALHGPVDLRHFLGAPSRL